MSSAGAALRTLEALQDRAGGRRRGHLTAPRLDAHQMTRAAPPPLVHRPQPNEPERGAEPGLESS